MIIRDLTVKDSEQYRSIMFELHSLHTDNRPDIFTAVDEKFWDIEKVLNEDNSILFGVEDGGELLGICKMAMRMNLGDASMVKLKRAYIDHIFVSKFHRCEGIGTLLYNEAVKRAEKEKADCVELTVWNFNKAAMEFYKSLGMTARYMAMEKRLG